MKSGINWKRSFFVVGVIGLIIGAIDPLEGSIVIMIGSILLAISTHWSQDRHRHLFRATAILILFGVASLFYLSSLGGFGGESALSWWWGVLILPYPIGWVSALVILIYRLIQSKRKS